MALTINTFREFWDHNTYLALGLVSVGTLLTLWSAVIHQSPGVSIGLLALVAGIMSIRPEMHIFEKMAWVVILVSLAYMEVRAI